MVLNYHYYLIDTVSETILAQFFAKSSAMAKKLLDSFDFDKAKLSRNDCKVFVDDRLHVQLETFDEIMNCENVQDCSELVQTVSEIDL